MKILFSDIVKSQPEEYEHSVNMSGACLENTIVILDDDPTGCQTVHDVPVLFSWDIEILESLLREKTHLFFILTNTRSMNEASAGLTVKEVIANLVLAGKNAERKFTIISRSDSTLRGHYPSELDEIEGSLGVRGNMHCLIPAFFPGGRYTCNDIHYVREGDSLIPASETPFAKDKVFGFQHSDLKKYVEEKTSGAILAEDVLPISLEEIRKGGPAHIKSRLMDSDNPVCIVNALCQSDLDVFAAGAWEAILAGKKILFRTAASFINSFGCIPVKEPLDRSVLKSQSGHGGLVVVGSYVEKSSIQLMKLIENGSAIPMELDVKELIEGESSQLLSGYAARITQLIVHGKHALLYTSRELVFTDDAEKNLEIGNLVSGALVKIVSMIGARPSFIITKGGITSNDIASKSLKIRKATVLGQALPGVPLLIPDNMPDMKYIIFPGNVGDGDDLLKLFKKLTE